ncbi:hypothetical protein HPB47_013530 [Ixodes persulcatus]|uniref:Uncharacterized protein n=1 Tax=Ixodes persulcatus TaxID=34615 RepID=A0AC60R023_IXOPE|nr:hypothetical protein HPB47_013530 [Ixodes persulcatus]
MRVCSAHFAKEDFLWNTIDPNVWTPTLKRLKQGTMPSLRLPVRVHDRPAPMPRSQRCYRTPGSASACVERSLVLGRLQPFRDDVMVDKGFHVDAECNKLGLGVVQPPFLRQQQQFSVADAMKTVSAQVSSAPHSLPRFGVYDIQRRLHNCGRSLRT